MISDVHNLTHQATVNTLGRTIDLDRIDAVLFDFDGVVVQSEDVYDQATKKLGAYYQLEIPESFFEANRGIAETLFYERFKQAFTPDVELDTLSVIGKRILWDEFSTSVRYTEGFQKFYDKVRTRVNHVGLVTATPRALIDQIFRNSNIQVKFDHIVTASDVEHTKPAPDPYLKMCQDLNVQPGRSLVIEDSPTGLSSAIKAGCQTIGITTSCSRDSLKEANFVVDSFGELEELLTIV